MGWTDNWFTQYVTATGLSLVDGQIYYFSVKSEDGAGLQSSAFTSNGQTVQLITTGIQEQMNNNGFAFYPNPFTNNANIIYQLKETATVNITITDVLGKELVLFHNENQAAGKYELAVNSADLNLSAGIYFVKMKTNDQLNTLKIIIK